MCYEDYFALASLAITIIGVLIAIIGVLFVVLAYAEYSRLRDLRKDFHTFRKQWALDQRRIQKAQQRVIASYGVQDADQKIALLKSAVALDPATFNGYNALGYAHLDKGDKQAAIDAFKEAIHAHPEAKEGYFDLAYIYLGLDRPDLAREYLERAIEVDPTSREDIEQDEQLRGVMGE
jgi:tetratricopeptide (TPR) repeat protein